MSIMHTAFKIGVAGTFAAWSGMAPAERAQDRASPHDALARQAGSNDTGGSNETGLCIAGIDPAAPGALPHEPTTCPAFLATALPAKADASGMLPLGVAPQPAFDDRPRPQWEHRFDATGPSIELGALGFGRPGTPSLVHFAFAWDF
ncbi:hypothetical protein RXV95_10680 [Novosphingobium sp. ZN18A2]|uniref:hypothetical protein n=1 Tax=Novosphingobium sp. ZN18A2 TaxID=3079861 RepID=UPI0030CB35CB